MVVESTIEAFTKARRTIVDRVEVPVGESTGVTSTLKMLTGGKLRTDRIVIITATGPLGTEVVALPFSGNNPLPGEFYVAVDGALRAPAAYAEATFGSKWHVAGDDELQQWLRGQRFGADDLPTELKHGLVKMSLPWTAQVFPTAANRSLLVAALGGFSGLGSLKSAMAFAQQIAPSIAASTAPTAAAPLHDLRFSEVALAAMRGDLRDSLTQDAPERVELDPAAAAAAITAALEPMKGKRIDVGGIAEDKRRTNVTTKVAPGVAGESLVAFIDTGLRANGKAGVAFTDERVYISEIGDKWDLAYNEVRSVRHEGQKVIIETSDTEPIKLLVGQEAEAIHAALAAICGR